MLNVKVKRNILSPSTPVVDTPVPALTVCLSWIEKCLLLELQEESFQGILGTARICIEVEQEECPATHNPLTITL